MRTPYGVANLEKLSAVELVLHQQDVNCNQLYNFPVGDIPQPTLDLMTTNLAKRCLRSTSSSFQSHQSNRQNILLALSALVNPSSPPLFTRDLTKLRRRRQEERQKGSRFNEQNNSALASRFCVHFFAVPAQLLRELSQVYLRTGTARR